VMALAGARAGLGLGALSCLVVALGGLLALQRLDRRPAGSQTPAAAS
jgi:hypothetical protein